MVFLGQAGPLKINLDEIEQRLNRPDYAPVAESLREIGIHSAVDLLAAYAGQKSDLAPWYAGAELNRDGDLRLPIPGRIGASTPVWKISFTARS